MSIVRYDYTIKTKATCELQRPISLIEYAKCPFMVDPAYRDLLICIAPRAWCASNIKAGGVAIKNRVLIRRTLDYCSLFSLWLHQRNCWVIGEGVGDEERGTSGPREPQFACNFPVLDDLEGNGLGYCFVLITCCWVSLFLWLLDRFLNCSLFIFW